MSLTTALEDDLAAALRRTLNFLENTEGELGITLDSADAARSALALYEREYAPQWRQWPPNVTLKTGEEIIAYRPDAGTFAALFIEDDNEEGGNWFASTGDDLTNDLPTLWREMPYGPSNTKAAQ